ncbi:MAG: galactokinase, partial [Hyphomonadaceae bacterium]|nr:galactokinase [Clostridia bacterium]
GYKIVISNTNNKHSLGSSKYNERRAQCDQALALLQTRLPQASCLGEISVVDFDANSDVLTDPIIKNRAQHVVYEDDRVIRSIAALEANELVAFGKLMIGSHESLRDLYEVSCSELDIMVEEALKIEGVLGSRMTGAGFGGCTVSIVREDAVSQFIEQVGKNYAERSGLKADFYVSEIGDGGQEIIL